MYAAVFTFVARGMVAALVALTLAAATRAEKIAAAEKRVRVAAISFVPEKLAVTRNAERLTRLVREAAAGGAELVVAPEGAIDGYVINQVLDGSVSVDRMREAALPIDDPVIAGFRTLARELRVCLVFGFAEKIGDEIYNTAVFIDGAGGIRGKYHKMLFAEGYHASWWFNRLGSRSRTFETPFGRCGILICNDRWNPELAQIPALDGAQFLVIPAYGSTSRGQDEAVLSRARETKLPIVEANVGVSLVVNAGEPVALERKAEGITWGEITIAAAPAPQPARRDEVEREFLAWREGEMKRRFEAKRHRFDGTSR